MFDRSLGAVRQRSGFSLIELLVAMAIITLLLGMLGNVAIKVRRSAAALKCRTNMRFVAMDFQMFADGDMAEDRGESAACPNNIFFFEDFVEKQYRVAEFWPGGRRGGEPMVASQEPSMCPAGPDELVRVPNRPCNDGAVLPYANVSYAFNRRLYSETIEFGGRQVFNPDTKVTARVLSYPNVPIAFDGDGAEADRRRRTPYFSAPPVRGVDDLYSGGTWWFPSNRHDGKTNVVFVGGHVLSSEAPERESGWAWEYQTTPLP